MVDEEKAEKPVLLTPSVHRRLAIFAAEHGFTFSEAVYFLLTRSVLKGD